MHKAGHMRRADLAVLLIETALIVVLPAQVVEGRRVLLRGRT